MSEDGKKSVPESAPATESSSRWYWMMAGAVFLALVAALWIDRSGSEPAGPPRPAARTAAQSMPPAGMPRPVTAPEGASDLPADHPPVGGEGQAPRGTPQGMTGISYDVNDARQVWERSCAMCHGMDGRPTRNGASLGTPDLTDPQIRAGFTEEGLERIIREGRPPTMPPYGEKLPDATIHELIHVVEALGSGS
jgi:mono/diheme cytochrome c family protein